MFVPACARLDNQIYVQIHGWWQTPLHKITKRYCVYIHKYIHKTSVSSDYFTKPVQNLTGHKS